MNDVKLNFLLTIACLIAVSLGCRNANFQPPPEDGVIKLDKLGESPKAKDGNYKSGDQVAVIDNDGKISLSKVVNGTAGKLVLYRGRSSWESADRPSLNSSYDEENVERTVPEGYQLRTVSNHPFYELFPPEQVFPAPWANNLNLKVGDVVFKNSSDFLDGEKAVISEVPVKRFGKFRVRFGANENSSEIEASQIYTSIEPAKSENLSPGDFVYYDRKTRAISHWAMVIDKRGDKIIIRQVSDSKAEDILVDVSKLQILK